MRTFKTKNVRSVVFLIISHRTTVQTTVGTHTHTHTLTHTRTLETNDVMTDVVENDIAESRFK